MTNLALITKLMLHKFSDDFIRSIYDFIRRKYVELYVFLICFSHLEKDNTQEMY